MKVHCIGLDFRTAGIEVREKLAFPRDTLGQEVAKLRDWLGCSGVVILSTCNRTEIYCSGDRELDWNDVFAYLADKAGAELAWDAILNRWDGKEAKEHLLRVVSGLESMVLGETEIFGQVKDAYSVALEAGVTDAVLNKLFQAAFRVGKRVRSETAITQGSTSVGSVAVDLAERIFGSLGETRVMILGAGEMSRVTAQALKSRGARSVLVANRSYGRAQELAGAIGGKAVDFATWQEYLPDIDIVIASTASPEPVVLRKDLDMLRIKRKYRSLFLIDIALPRDVEPGCGEIDEVYLYDLDALQELADEGRKRREAEVIVCEGLIAVALARLEESLEEWGQGVRST